MTVRNHPRRGAGLRGVGAALVVLIALSGWEPGPGLLAERPHGTQAGRGAASGSRPAPTVTPEPDPRARNPHDCSLLCLPGSR